VCRWSVVEWSFSSISARARGIVTFSVCSWIPTLLETCV